MNRLEKLLPQMEGLSEATQKKLQAAIEAAREELSSEEEGE